MVIKIPKYRRKKREKGMGIEIPQSYSEDHGLKQEILKQIQKYKSGEKLEKQKKVTIEDLDYYLKPLLRYKRYIEVIYVYGSAISRGEANDIDVIIIVDDTDRVNEFAVDLIEKECGFIEEKAKKEGFRFHFQPVKLLSKWWHLLIEGEPWIVSSLKHTYIFYDKRNLVKEIQEYIGKNILYKREEKTERLIERSSNSIIKNRQILLQAVATLSNVSTEAAQILFLFENKLFLNRRKIGDELKKYESRIGKENVDTYIQIIDLEEKVEHGTLSEFTAENLEYYSEKIKNLINKIELILAQQKPKSEDKKE
ncbi:hypothetical protein J4465_01355 [Candidatus Pacearchaeota archaeon]|nr:hypothetical protein [Candidatus Pacearchaeota archaeon]